MKSELRLAVFGFWWSVRLLGRSPGSCGGSGGGAAFKNGLVFYPETHTAASRYLLMFTDAIFRLEKHGS